MKPIDVASNGLLKYNNEDGGDCFQYRLANIEQITSLLLTIHNQDDEFIPSFSDYILLLQFIRHLTKEDKTHTMLETMLDYIKQIYLIIYQIALVRNLSLQALTELTNLYSTRYAALHCLQHAQ